MNKIIKKEYVYFLILPIIILLLIISIIFPEKQYKIDLCNSNNGNFYSEIGKSGIFYQEFISNRNYEKVGIKFGTYNNIIRKGKIVVTIIDGNKKKTTDIKPITIIDNEYFYFKYPIKKKKTYSIKIEIKNLSNPVSLYMTNENYNGSSLYINDKENDSNIKLAFAYKTNSYYNSYYFVVIITFLLIYGVLNIDVRSIKNEKV